MDRLFLADFRVRGIIGVNEWERENPQEILVNVSLFGDFSPVGTSDDLSRGVNYKIVARKIRAHVENASRYTVEALAEDIASLCLQEPAVASVRVKVEKPGAVRFAGSVGVEIERVKKEV